jgi:hypothetical protein
METRTRQGCALVVGRELAHIESWNTDLSAHDTDDRFTVESAESMVNLPFTNKDNDSAGKAVPGKRSGISNLGFPTMGRGVPPSPTFNLPGFGRSFNGKKDKERLSKKAGMRERAISRSK